MVLCLTFVLIAGYKLLLQVQHVAFLKPVFHIHGYLRVIAAHTQAPKFLRNAFIRNANTLTGKRSELCRVLCP